MTDFENLTVDALIALALTTSSDDDGDGGDGWAAIRELERRGTREIFERCSTMSQSDDPCARRVAVDVLGQLGWTEHPYACETVPILIDLIDRETDIDVLSAIGAAVGHLHAASAIRPLLRLKDHPDENVRFGLAVGLLGFDDPDTIAALIELSRDSDDEIRDWATFGLGSQIERDTPEIREALIARLTDEDENARGEALSGLAQRKDERVLEPLIAELRRFTENDLRGVLPLEAAEALADPRVLPALLAYQASWDDEKTWIYDHLVDAIAACSPNSGASE